MGKCHVSVEGGFLLRQEGESIIDCQMYVMEDLKSRIEMTSGQFVSVGRKEGMRRSKVGAC